MKGPSRLMTLFALLMILTACGPKADARPAAVIEATDAAWNAGDVDALLDLYAKDGLEINGRGTFYGKDELRALFEGMVGEFTVDCGNYFTAGKQVTYDCLYVITDTGGLGVEQYLAVIVDGKIKANIRTDRFDPSSEFKIDSTIR